MLTNGGVIVLAQSSEISMAYLVNNSVMVTDLASITSADDAQWNSMSISTANTTTALNTTGLANGTYYLYSVDFAGNLSGASATTYII